jgi:hypothetical protein
MQLLLISNSLASTGARPTGAHRERQGSGIKHIDETGTIRDQRSFPLWEHARQGKDIASQPRVKDGLTTQQCFVTS